MATTRAAQRADVASGLSAGFGLTNGIRALFTLCLTTPSMAGSSVIEASMVTATMIAEP